MKFSTYFDHYQVETHQNEAIVYFNGCHNEVHNLITFSIITKKVTLL